MKRFGPIWNPNLGDIEVVQTPLGQLCQACDEPIEDADQGLIIPYYATLSEEPQYRPWHLDCFLKNVGIGA